MKKSQETKVLFDSLLKKYVGKPNTEETRKAMVKDIWDITIKQV